MDEPLTVLGVVGSPTSTGSPVPASAAVQMLCYALGSGLSLLLYCMFFVLTLCHIHSTHHQVKSAWCQKYH